MTMTRYAIEIDNLLDKMFALKKHVLPANRRSVEQYLDVVWSPITELTTGFRRIERSEVAEERFQSYVDAEESRLRDALKDINYDIDAADILQLVTGPGRVEKVRLNIAPLFNVDLILRHSSSSHCFGSFSNETSRSSDCPGTSFFTETNFGIQRRA